MQLDRKRNKSDMAGFLNRVVYDVRNFRFQVGFDWGFRRVSQSL